MYICTYIYIYLCICLLYIHDILFSFISIFIYILLSIQNKIPLYTLCSLRNTWKMFFGNTRKMIFANTWKMFFVSNTLKMFLWASPARVAKEALKQWIRTSSLSTRSTPERVYLICLCVYIYIYIYIICIISLYK